MGYVYFALCEHVGMVKIGYTGANPHNRAKTLQTGCPFYLYIAAYVDGTLELERKLHETFDFLHMGEGEWFANTLKLEHLVWTLSDYAESNGKNAWVSQAQFEMAMHDNVLGCVPHPDISEKLWDRAADTRHWEYLAA